VKRVLLHGFAGGPRSFPAQLDALAPDLPGHGAAPDALSWEACLDALEPLIDERTMLIGYSMGARIALALALRRPVARLVLESGTAGIEDAGERLRRREDDEQLARILDSGDARTFVERWEQHPSLASLLPFAADLRAERMRHRPAGLASALRQLGTGAQPSYWMELANLRMPVTLIAGARDEKFAALARRMSALLPRCELHLLDAGHAPHLETPQAFLGALP
jgi:2-succinyl-6-hydroxy-2,4-cyclohexadiene-1-carboxylate synthase